MIDTILITGTAGFIGFHLANNLLNKGYRIIGYDGITDYYDVNLKKDRHKILKKNKNFVDIENMLENYEALMEICKKYRPTFIIHLAAQAGVRYSINNPRSYVNSNLIGTFNILELSKILNIKHLLLSSTSSVYGENKSMPFTETLKSDEQLSFYAATKKSNEVMAHSYSHIFGIPTTIFRFFTVYGPWGRPDMALFKFTKAILNKEPIKIFNNGNMKRDFTYVSDLVEGISLLVNKIPKYTNNKTLKNDSISKVAPFRIVNIGNSHPVELIDFINELEKKLGIKAKRNFLGMQQGDIKETWADTSLINNLTGYKPKINITEGIGKFVEWYKSYYKEY